jgi:hypothetical protein
MINFLGCEIKYNVYYKGKGCEVECYVIHKKQNIFLKYFANKEKYPYLAVFNFTQEELHKAFSWAFKRRIIEFKEENNDENNWRQQS